MSGGRVMVKTLAMRTPLSAAWVQYLGCSISSRTVFFSLFLLARTLARLDASRHGWPRLPGCAFLAAPPKTGQAPSLPGDYPCGEMNFVFPVVFSLKALSGSF